MTPKHFIGYALAEEWLDACDRSRHVYAEQFTEPGRTSKHGYRVDRLVIYLAQIDDREHVHYCRLVVGQQEYVAGQPFTQDHDSRQATAVQAWEIAQAWLADCGCQVRHGVIATPHNMLWLDGWANFLHFDKQTKTFSRNGAQK